MRQKYRPFLPFAPFFEKEPDTYYCQKCRTRHRYNSKIGERHAGRYGLMTRELED